MLMAALLELTEDRQAFLSRINALAEKNGVPLSVVREAAMDAGRNGRK